MKGKKIEYLCVSGWGMGVRWGVGCGWHAGCQGMMTKGMVFRYTWVYSKEDTMAHTRRLMVTS